MQTVQQQKSNFKWAFAILICVKPMFLAWNYALSPLDGIIINIICSLTQQLKCWAISQMQICYTINV